MHHGQVMTHTFTPTQNTKNSINTSQIQKDRNLMVSSDGTPGRDRPKGRRCCQKGGQRVTIELISTEDGIGLDWTGTWARGESDFIVDVEQFLLYTG